jgi:hypothetical protein
MVAHHQGKNSSLIGNKPTLANGFGFCAPQKSILRYKQKDSNKMAQRLKAASDNEIIEAIIYRLEKCNEKQNLWVAKDLHTTDGECFDARGNLASCGSRFCSQCVSIPSRRNAKIADYILDKLKHRNLRFIVLTMPDDALSHLSWLEQRKVFYYACRWLTTKSKWWKDNVDGVIRNDEFTAKLHRKNLYHYHSNFLTVLKTFLLLSHLKMKQEWAKALKVSFNHFGYEWHCPTKNGLPNVYIKRIVANVKDGEKEISREKVIAELCKYATKPQDWDNVRIEDIAEIVKLERFPRMFEVLGICKTIAKAIRPKPRQNAVNEQDNYRSNLNAKTYVHTTFITVPKTSVSSNHFGRPPPKLKQKSWFRRLRDNEITINQYKIEFDFTVERTKRFRKIQLRQRYPFATFQTLDGQSF